MSDSTRRALRTAYQALIAAVTTIPVILALLSQVLPADSTASLATYIVAITAGVAAVSKLLNALEDAGLIPAWLKGDTAITDQTSSDGTPSITTLPEPTPVEPPADAPVDPSVVHEGD